ncbi:TonB family protein [Caulobacter sp. AP07]|nr:TonB family protein [Caulobacter sp. AP07]
MRKTLRLGPLLGALVLLTAPNGALAREPQRLINDAIWLRKPNAREFAALYPSSARSQQKGGWAVLSCRVAASGRVEACKIALEAPVGLGFGPAAVKMTEAYFRFAPKTKSGATAEGGYVHIPIIFQGPPGEAAPPLRTYAAGQPAMLITTLPSSRMSKSGSFPCPKTDKPEALCLAHEFYWKTKSDVDVSAPILRASGQTTGVSVLNCAVGDAGVLKDCQVQGDVTAGGKAAILKLATTFEAPDKAEDKTPITDGRIVAMFDWPTLLKAYEVLAPLDAAP